MCFLSPNRLIAASVSPRACVRESLGACDGLPKGLSAANECVYFESSERTVPNDRTRLTQLARVRRSRARSNIKNDIVIGDCVGRDDSG